MANVNGPFGFRPARPNGGGTPNRMGEYSIASGLAANIYYGDLVKSTGTDTNITIAGVGETVLGVFAGCSYVDEEGRPKFASRWPTGQVATDIKAYVYDDPQQRFVAQATTVANTNIGDLCDHSVGTGSATTGNSGAQVDNTTYTTGTTLKVTRLSPVVGNEYGAYGKVEVLIVDHELEG
jgi:hypothetical protein